MFRSTFSTSLHSRPEWRVLRPALLASVSRELQGIRIATAQDYADQV